MHKLDLIMLTALLITASAFILFPIGNAIYINQSITTLDKWDEISTGGIRCGFEPSDGCYHNNFKFIESIGGLPLENDRFYTPLSAWYGFEIAGFSDLSYHHIYRLYKHDSIIPFRTEYLVVCVY